MKQPQPATDVPDIKSFVVCQCSPVSQCPSGAPSCVSTTGCFHSLYLDESKEYIRKEIFGCFPNNTNQVDLHCRQLPPVNPLVYCCSISDGDYCNRNLAPQFPRSPVDAFFSSRNYAAVTIVLVLPLCTLLCGLLAIALLWKYVLKPHLKKKSACLNPIPTRRRSNYLRRVLNKWRSKGMTENSCHRTKHALIVDVDGGGRTFQGKHRKRDSSSTGPVRPANEIVSCTSGSGSGLPFLVQRTIARYVQLIACIGKGRFGEVWRATCQGEAVAVKIFSSRDEASWARETEVYNTGLLQHPNLLAYYASDMISRAGCTQLWLITAYHANGSLYDYLSGRTLTMQEGLRLARSICSGLAFLHTEIRGLQAKPAIAHRDIKSKNVLVRNDKEACIADLGLALVQSKPSVGSGNKAPGLSDMSYGTSGTSNSDYFHGGFSGFSSIGALQPAGPRVGTKRYMAPELLLAIDSGQPSSAICLDHPLGLSDDNPTDFTSISYLPFEVYQAADVYALSLVLWEIMRCTEGSVPCGMPVEGYQIPYQNVVPTDPSFAQMRSVVCADLYTSSTDSIIEQSQSDMEGSRLLMSADHQLVQPAASETQETAPSSNKCRPPISARWLGDPYLARVAHLIQECWHRDWAARLSALRVRKNLEALELSLANDTAPPGQ
ncbi:unnamed protein product [Calicophoron daubneyi]|uniref:receptor protein serine/threonine kinase n=1 Tax=Calicophoron daubneyi TaxID=300641 RepID=A0AAV2TC35_CALDB